MQTGDVELLEQSLLALADQGVDIRLALFERFFALFPSRRASFWALDTSSRRMTDETLQLMHGIAGQQGWVWPLVCDLVYNHRSYGALPMAEYDRFIDLVADEVVRATAAPPAAQAAWQRQAEALQALVRKAAAAWDVAAPLTD